METGSNSARVLGKCCSLRLMDTGIPGRRTTLLYVRCTYFSMSLSALRLLVHLGERLEPFRVVVWVVRGPDVQRDACRFTVLSSQQPNTNAKSSKCETPVGNNVNKGDASATPLAWLLKSSRLGWRPPTGGKLVPPQGRATHWLDHEKTQ